MRASRKYDGIASNIRDYKKIIKNEKINSFLDQVRSSDDMKIIQYEGIDLADNYVVTKYGDVISTKSMRKLTISKRDAYSTVHLVDTSGKSHCLYLHRVVALNFIPNPNNYPIINHKDQNPSNNNVDNLEWCTYSYNNTYADAKERRIETYKETIKRKGGQWNKGKKMK